LQLMQGSVTTYGMKIRYEITMEDVGRGRVGESDNPCVGDSSMTIGGQRTPKKNISSNPNPTPQVKDPWQPL